VDCGWDSEKSLDSLPLGVVHSHPSPAEYVEVLQELQRLESRLQPFLQRYYEVLGAAATTDYNNNVSSLMALFSPLVLPKQIRLRCR
jgi:hypothetical protein